MVNTAVQLSGVRLDNPVIPASGTFGFGYEFAQWYDINCLGAISVKGTTREPRFGNPTPRIAETPGGMLNAVGLQNPGIDKVVAEELPRLREVYHKPILANISGFSLDEYVECCAKADASPHTDLIEVNVSCPNVHHGGMSFGTDPNMVYDVTRAVKAVCKKPVYMKLSPNVTDIVSIAKACQEGGRRRIEPYQHPHGDADRSEKARPRSGQHHRRPLWPRHLPGGPADGVAGL